MSKQRELSWPVTQITSDEPLAQITSAVADAFATMACSHFLAAGTGETQPLGETARRHLATAIVFCRPSTSADEEARQGSATAVARLVLKDADERTLRFFQPTRGATCALFRPRPVNETSLPGQRLLDILAAPVSRTHSHLGELGEYPITALSAPDQQALRMSIGNLGTAATLGDLLARLEVLTRQILWHRLGIWSRLTSTLAARPADKDLGKSDPPGDEGIAEDPRMEPMSGHDSGVSEAMARVFVQAARIHPDADHGVKLFEVRELLEDSIAKLQQLVRDLNSRLCAEDVPRETGSTNPAEAAKALRLFAEEVSEETDDSVRVEVYEWPVSAAPDAAASSTLPVPGQKIAQ